jgi:hypothetical protein
MAGSANAKTTLLTSASSTISPLAGSVIGRAVRPAGA